MATFEAAAGASPPVGREQIKSALLSRIPTRGGAFACRPLSALVAAIDGLAREVPARVVTAYLVVTETESFEYCLRRAACMCQVCDRVNLVCGPDLVPKALADAPNRFGIIEADRAEDDSIRLTVLRAARPNFERTAAGLEVSPVCRALVVTIEHGDAEQRSVFVD